MPHTQGNQLSYSYFLKVYRFSSKAQVSLIIFSWFMNLLSTFKRGYLRINTPSLNLLSPQAVGRFISLLISACNGCIQQAEMRGRLSQSSSHTYSCSTGMLFMAYRTPGARRDRSNTLTSTGGLMAQSFLFDLLQKEKCPDRNIPL